MQQRQERKKLNCNKLMHEREWAGKHNRREAKTTRGDDDGGEVRYTRASHACKFTFFQRTC